MNLSSVLGNLFSPRGTQGPTRSRLDRTLSEYEEANVLGLNPRRSRTLEGLGNKMLLQTDPAGRVFRIYSLIPGTRQIRIGRLDLREPLMNGFPFADNVMDRQSFMNYLFNFKNLVYDVRDGSLVPVSADEALEFKMRVERPNPLRRYKLPKRLRDLAGRQ